MIRVLQVFASLNVGGAESRMMDIFRCIDKNKFAFDFLTMQLEEQYFESEIRSLGGNVIKIAPPRDSGTLNNLNELTRIMHEGNYDVVHAHTSYHCGIVMLAAKRAKIPVRISHSRTTGSKHKGKKAQLMLSLGRFLIKRYANVCLAISQESGDYLFGSKAFKVLPNAIDLRSYERRDDAAIAALRVEFKLNDAEVVLGQVGRFDNMKNHGFTLELFAQYLKKHPSAKLVFVGDGPLRSQREQEARTLGIADRVVFTGVRSDVANWMYLFDKLLVPSVFEGLGGVILEAQAAGTPVIKSDSFTDAADLNIGLVRNCKLNSIENWLVTMEDDVVIPTRDNILNAFTKSGYSLTAIVNILSTIYTDKD